MTTFVSAAIAVYFTQTKSFRSRQRYWLFSLLVG
jgi:hypothetical protein